MAALTLSRRRLLAAATLAGTSGFWHAPPARAETLAPRLAEIEARTGGRLGVAIRDTGSGRRWSHRADERFPLMSTFKAFACAAVLAKVDRGAALLDAPVTVTPADIQPHSPVTGAHAGGRLSLGALCAAATAVSDNAAANLILAQIGGPEGLTRFMRAMGDEATRLDRWETALNAGTPGDPRDTTTPAAAARSLEALLLADVLSPASRGQLTAWLEADAVAGALLRAGLPAGWRIADRTGAGGHGSRGIIAMMWPPGRPPVVAAVYLTQTDLSLEARDAVMAEIGRALVEVLR
ncbi:class A beta-lactamase [Xanthobacter sediminis]|uniref:class A beta-lactamase n=1 Tax=Xanthobacter sediminis TaxID=3119926 RepID=UPI00372C4479